MPRYVLVEKPMAVNHYDALVDGRGAHQGRAADGSLHVPLSSADGQAQHRTGSRKARSVRYA